MTSRTPFKRIYQKTKKLFSNQKRFYIVSFPKSGRTWLRMMLGYAIAKHCNIPFSTSGELLEVKALREKDNRIPQVKIRHDDDPFWKKPDELTPSKEKFKGSSVILLVRDPRDVLISSYFEKTKRDFVYEEGKKFTGSLSDYLNEEIGGFETLLRYYNIWFENRNMPKNLLLVRYEDIQESPAKELGRILEFMGLKHINLDLVQEAAQYSSFDNMKKMEAAGSGSWRLTPGDKKDPESFKTRKGKVGGYKDYLGNQEIEKLNLLMEKKLSPWFKYTP
jgi:hypothetical protein